VVRVLDERKRPFERAMIATSGGNSPLRGNHGVVQLFNITETRFIEEVWEC
jgi:hypothetical protein